MFTRTDAEGKIYRNAVTVDCQKAVKDGEKILTEQNHKGVVDINQIVKRHAGDLEMIAKNNQLIAMKFDQNPNNDFHEMMNMLVQGQAAFDSLPSKVRKEFDYDPALYLDYIRNPDNTDDLIKRGWVEAPPPPPQPVEVIVTNPTPETPPE